MKLRRCLLGFSVLLALQLNAQTALVKKMGTYIFQYDPKDSELINDPSKFSSTLPLHLQINSSEEAPYFLHVELKSASAIFVDNKLYKRSIKGGSEMIPLKNMAIFAGKANYLVSFEHNWSPEFSKKLNIVTFAKPKFEKIGNNSIGPLTKKIPQSYHSAHYFNQFAFIALMAVTVFFSQSLFAKRTVFVGAAAIRQSRYRSMDDNLKLFGFNVLIFSSLFSGFSFNKMGLNDYIFFVFLKNLLLVTLFFGAKIFLNGASKKIFFDSNALSFYANNYLHITALFGIFLASVFYLEAFSFFRVPFVPIGSYLALFMLAEVAYVVSFAFMNYELSRYKLFYIISYICAFEGIPLLILAKYLFQKGIISS